MDWCRAQLCDLLPIWDVAKPDERARLLGGIFEWIEASLTAARSLKIVAVPKTRPGSGSSK